MVINFPLMLRASNTPDHCCNVKWYEVALLIKLIVYLKIWLNIVRFKVPNVDCKCLDAFHPCSYGQQLRFD
uniref:Uncharacterized protein n=1 Tax=Arundo donax TaxID=35708 RepID=A0A0A9HA22_ARUDO